MTTLEELLAPARRRMAFSGEPDTFAITGDADPAQVAAALMFHFGEDDGRQAVRILLNAKEIGYLLRSDLYGHAGPAMKGIGVSDYAGLPGAPDVRPVRLRCPVADCPYHLLVLFFDEDHPPMCTTHPDKALTIAR